MTFFDRDKVVLRTRTRFTGSRFAPEGVGF